MNRIPTKIKGFDDLIEGGFPEYSAILLSGSPGTGKSIMALEYLYNGALHFGDIGIYVSLEQKENELIEQAKQLGLNEFERLVNERKIRFMCFNASDVDVETVNNIVNMAKNEGAKRLVLDSLSALSINAPVYEIVKGYYYKEKKRGSSFMPQMAETEDLRKNFIYRFIQQLKEIPVTTLLLSEVHANSELFSSDGLSEFVCDGVIMLRKTTVGEDITRTLHLEKMRLTKLSIAMKEFDFGNSGIIVNQ